jgi:hypothetical protein
MIALALRGCDCLSRQPRELRLRQRHDGEASLPQQRRIREQLVGFDLSERGGMGERFPGGDYDKRRLRIARVHGNHRGAADGALFIARVVKDQVVAGRHFAQMLHRRRIRHAVPLGLFIALQIRKGICG